MLPLKQRTIWKKKIDDDEKNGLIVRIVKEQPAEKIAKSELSRQNSVISTDVSGIVFLLRISGTSGPVTPAQHLHLGKSEVFDQAAKFRKSSARFPAGHLGKTCHHTLEPLAWLE